MSTILIVDDDTINLQVLANLLEDEYAIVLASTGNEALDCIKRQKPDLILLDVMMPDMDGYDVCKQLKKQSDTAEIPVIFITALDDRKAEALGFEVGAVDYVTKPISPPVVRMRVLTHIELKRARDELSRLALTDALTGLANRRRFDQALEDEHRRMSRLKDKLSLIMLDIDYFKQFNDTYGHVAGDECLRRVAQVIGATMYRQPDVAARFGGEEFACIMPQTSHAGVLAVAKRIQRGIEGLKIGHSASCTSGYVSASMGVITVMCDIKMMTKDIIVFADQQLYRAKSTGRNCIMTAEITE